jgi:hypothetical protein
MVDDGVQLAFPGRVRRLGDAFYNLLQAMPPEQTPPAALAARGAAEQELTEFLRFMSEARKGEDLTKRRG